MKKNTLVIALIAIVGLIIYIQTINYDYSADDGIYTYHNNVTQKGLTEWTELFKYGSMNFLSIGAVNTGTYRPISLLTFALENELAGGFNPFTGHLINIILYGLVIFIVGMILLELKKIRDIPIIIIIISLLLYTVHPLHIEVVASVKSRDTLLCAFFGFLSIFLWIKWYDYQTVLKHFIVAVIFLLALLSKEEALPLVAVSGLIAYFFKKDNIYVSFKAIIPFIFPSIIYLLIRSIILDSGNMSNGIVYNTKLNSILYGTTISEHIASNFYIYIQYFKILIFPHPLSWDYSFAHFEVQSFQEPIVWISILIIGFLIWLAWRGLENKSIVSFWIIFYFLTFSIFANLTKSLIIGSNFGERFLFIPSLSFCFLVVYGTYMFFEKIPRKRTNLYIVALFTPILFAFSWKTIDHSRVWKSNLSLTESGIKSSPKSWRTNAYYGDHLRITAKEIYKVSIDSSMPYFEKSKEALNKSLGILGTELFTSTYLIALSETLLYLGDTLEAESSLDLVLEKKPNSAYALFKLGVINYSRGNFDAAEKHYLKALTSDSPDSLNIFNNLGLIYLKQNKLNDAIQMFEEYKNMDQTEKVDEILVSLYAKTGNIDKIKDFSQHSKTEELLFNENLRKAIDVFTNKNFKEAAELFRALNSDFEKFNGYEKFSTFYLAYGSALLQSNDTTSAKKILLTGLEKNPNNPDILTNLGTIAFLHEKNYPTAERYFSGVINNNPSNPFQSWANLGSVLLIQGKEKEALVAFENSLKYNSNKSILNNLYLISKSLGDKDKMEHYYQQISK
ncbi:tetratricopeptide repeat protein [Belliella sp. R4-6]|uniref:Tetratricopeptide repeat protein n=1 Tax=Belliella alkalica TaxID=1730871 RepID=A0ABS9VEE7_9BACT|nr:tetratricopeptide repeat protein [Belliella alkalica]MCH7414263.1 tetratricopeptide repeat protein [Belliella alkalica]